MGYRKRVWRIVVLVLLLIAGPNLGVADQEAGPVGVWKVIFERMRNLALTALDDELPASEILMRASGVT